MIVMHVLAIQYNQGDALHSAFLVWSSVRLAS